MTTADLNALAVKVAEHLALVQCDAAQWKGLRAVADATGRGYSTVQRWAAEAEVNGLAKLGAVREGARGREIHLGRLGEWMEQTKVKAVR